MKKRFFVYVIITLFIIIMFLYIFTSVENYLVKSLDLIDEKLDAKEIIFYQETIDSDGTYGKYLTNDGTIYTYSYASYGKISLDKRLLYIKEGTESKVEKISKKDKGYLNMFTGKLKDSCFKRKIKSDRPSQKIYYIDNKNSKSKVIISSGEEVMKNKSLYASRIISILKKYSIRVD